MLAHEEQILESGNLVLVARHSIDVAGLWLFYWEALEPSMVRLVVGLLQWPFG